MRRRDFIYLLSSAMVAAPLAARAQHPATPVIGFLSNSSPEADPHLTAALNRGLGDNGFVDGQNLTIDRRWADGRVDRLPTMAAELVRRQVALIVALSPPSALAAKGATATIPIVFHCGGDVVKMSLVAGLSRPGGNVTGVNLFTLVLESKKLDLLNRLVPSTGTFAYLTNPNNPAAEERANEMRDTARSLGRSLLVVGASTPTEIDAAFATLVDQRVVALVVMADQYFDGARRAQLVALAARNAIPALYGQREYALEGGLISYGTNLVETLRQTGNYAGRILKGERASDLPVVRPTKFELVINLKTARALGLDVPAVLLAIADEVIE
jgi:putative tryptophan/tyrosine transport system substrate-binding protein